MHVLRLLPPAESGGGVYTCRRGEEEGEERAAGGDGRCSQR